MTYNVNEGTGFPQVIGATTELEFLVGVGQILTQVQGTDPPERMRAVAREILDIQPELLSLLVCLNRRCLTTREGGLPRFPEADLNEAALRRTLSRARCQWYQLLTVNKFQTIHRIENADPSFEHLTLSRRSSSTS